MIEKCLLDNILLLVSDLDTVFLRVKDRSQIEVGRSVIESGSAQCVCQNWSFSTNKGHRRFKIDNKEKGIIF